MADKYLALSGGAKKEVEATTSSTGATNAGDIVALDASGKLDDSVLPEGVGDDAQSLTTSEALQARDMVNVHVVSSAVRVRKASGASGGYPAQGYVKAAAASGAAVNVYFDGTVSGFTGLTPGARYYLSATTAGAITATAVTGAGKLHQSVGFALSATELSFEPGEDILLA